MNRQTFLHRMGLGFLGALFARSASATTEPLPGAPDTADAVPAEPVGSFWRKEGDWTVVHAPVSYGAGEMFQVTTLDIARLAASGTNTQPWHVAVVSGEACDRLRDELCALFDGDLIRFYHRERGPLTGPKAPAGYRWTVLRPHPAA